MGLSWYLAWRWLRKRRRERFISVVAGFSFMGIVLGVGTLIVVTSVMNGFRIELFDRILGVTGHVQIHADARGLREYEELRARLVARADIIAVTPLVDAQVLVSSAEGSSGALLRGMSVADLKAKPQLFDALSRGDFGGFDEGDSVIIGWRLARRLGVDVGDRVRVISPEGRRSLFGVLPLVKSYRVHDTFNVGQYEYDSGFVYLPLSEAQRLLKKEDSVTQIEIETIDPERALLVRDAIRPELPPNSWALSWQQVNGTFYEAIIVQKNVMFLILTLIIVVAAFNIVSGQIMLVHDKRLGIAVLRSMGASRADIHKAFLIAGGLVGSLGALVGCAVGLVFLANINSIKSWLESLLRYELFSAEIYFLSTLPTHTNPDEVVLIIVMALVLAFVATLYPAWKAARVNPAEALRSE